jgi:putative restriction endonuclease
MAHQPFIAVTDPEWYDYLSRLRDGRNRVDEVNFWNPGGRPLKELGSGEPVFLRLKHPRNAIAGYGFFAHFTRLRLDEVWECFREKNGAASLLDLARLLAPRLQRDPASLLSRPPEIGCTILRDAVFWETGRWILWGASAGWYPNVVRGATERDPERSARLLAEIRQDHLGAPPELTQPFHLREADERRIVEAATASREGQGTFRAVLLDAYGRRCAITGERTEPVLDAAHIQPYLGPASNHVQNGILLTKEFHKLFDLGYVGITPEYEVMVSPRLRQDWMNGRRYYEHDRRPLAQLPDDPVLRPSREALAWHLDRKFKS